MAYEIGDRVIMNKHNIRSMPAPGEKGVVVSVNEREVRVRFDKGYRNHYGFECHSLRFSTTRYPAHIDLIRRDRCSHPACKDSKECILLANVDEPPVFKFDFKLGDVVRMRPGDPCNVVGPGTIGKVVNVKYQVTVEFEGLANLQVFHYRHTNSSRHVSLLQLVKRGSADPDYKQIAREAITLIHRMTLDMQNKDLNFHWAMANDSQTVPSLREALKFQEELDWPWPE